LTAENVTAILPARKRIIGEKGPLVLPKDFRRKYIMKKIAILLVLLAAAGFVYGQATISGSATTTLGIQLNGGEIYVGFKAENSTNISLTVAEAEGSTSSEDEWYGLVELTGASIVWNSDGDQSWDAKIKKDLNDDGDYDDTNETQWINNQTDYKLFLPFAVTAPTIAARITNGTMYIQLQSQPGFDYTNKAAKIEDVDDANEYDLEYADLGDIGLSLGYDSDMIDVVFEIVSAVAYDDGAVMPVADSAWGVGLGIDVAVTDDISVALGVATDINAAYSSVDSNDLMVSAGVDATVSIATISLGVDFLTATAGTTGTNFTASGLEAALGVDVDLAPITVSLDVFYNAMLPTDLVDFTTLTLDAEIGLSVDMDPVTAGLTVTLSDIMDYSTVSLDTVTGEDMDIKIAANAGYSDDVFGLSVEGSYAMQSTAGTAADPVIDLVIEITAALLDNTTFGVKYDLDELDTGDPVDSEDYGDITIFTTLEY